MTRTNTQAGHPELPACVEQDEEIAITRDGTVSAASRRAAFYGAWRGQVDMSRFDEADEEIAREFGMFD